MLHTTWARVKREYIKIPALIINWCHSVEGHLLLSEGRIVCLALDLDMSTEENEAAKNEVAKNEAFIKVMEAIYSMKHL